MSNVGSSVIDDYGCLNFPAGYYDWVLEMLTGLGYQVRYIDDSPQFPQQLEWHWDNLGSFQFRPKQEEALRLIEAAYKERRGGVIDAAAGFGKTELFAALAMLLPEAKILICVKSHGQRAEDDPGPAQVFTQAVSGPAWCRQEPSRLA